MTTEPNVDILRKVQGMLNIAAKAGTPAEAANAMGMAQRFMEQHNLTTAMLEKASGVDGKRQKDAVTGGQYTWQRELWSSVADLNFCLYWTQEYTAVRERTERSVINPNRVYYKGQPVTRKRHVVVGRTANVEVCKHTAMYLETTINRLLRERLTDSEGVLNSGDYNGRFGASFREGMADSIMERLNDKRRKMLNAERRRKEAAKAGASSGTAITLSTYIDEETDANNDFLYGKGWSADKAKQRAEDAAEKLAAEEAYTLWAAANPEEAKKREVEAAKRRRRSGGYSYAQERPKDWGAYRAGEDAGKKVSLDPQVDKGGGSTKKIGGGKAVYL
jgi:hypothetical protein